MQQISSCHKCGGDHGRLLQAPLSLVEKVNQNRRQLFDQMRLADFELNQVQQPWVQRKLWPGKCLIATAKCKTPCKQGYLRLPHHVFGSSFFILQVLPYAH